MNINEIQEEIIAEFEVFEDWLDKYNYLIELSSDLPIMDPRYKTSEYLINGCQSKVWLKAELKGEKIHYHTDSDSLITKGMLALLLRILDNQYPEDIVNADLYFIDKIGLNSNLSPSRVNGLIAIVKQFKSYANKASNIKE